MDRSQFYARMQQFLTDLSEETGGGGEAEAASVDPDQDLFDRGLLSSLAVVRVIAVMEEWCGEEIRIERHGLEAFYTLSRLYTVFRETVEANE
jgi:acyl carrier protein